VDRQYSFHATRDNLADDVVRLGMALSDRFRTECSAASTPEGHPQSSGRSRMPHSKPEYFQLRPEVEKAYGYTMQRDGEAPEAVRDLVSSAADTNAKHAALSLVNSRDRRLSRLFPPSGDDLAFSGGVHAVVAGGMGRDHARLAAAPGTAGGSVGQRGGSAGQFWDRKRLCLRCWRHRRMSGRWCDGILLGHSV
jgi:hypothetical protein